MIEIGAWAGGWLLGRSCRVPWPRFLHPSFHPLPLTHPLAIPIELTHAQDESTGADAGGEDEGLVDLGAELLREVSAGFILGSVGGGGGEGCGDV